MVGQSSIVAKHSTNGASGEATGADGSPSCMEEIRTEVFARLWKWTISRMWQCPCFLSYCQWVDNSVPTTHKQRHPFRVAPKVLLQSVACLLYFLTLYFFFFFFYEPVLFLSCLLGRSCALCSILAQDNTEREKQSEKLDELFWWACFSSKLRMLWILNMDFYLLIY